MYYYNCMIYIRMMSYILHTFLSYVHLWFDYHFDYSCMYVCIVSMHLGILVSVSTLLCYSLQVAAEHTSLNPCHQKDCNSWENSEYYTRIGMQYRKDM